MWIADAHCDDSKRFVVRADEILTAFLELESAIYLWRSKSWQSSTDTLSGAENRSTPLRRIKTRNAVRLRIAQVVFGWGILDFALNDGDPAGETLLLLL
jgi:hypothetical protein